jgi:hypothetical protein
MLTGYAAAWQVFVGHAKASHPNVVLLIISIPEIGLLNALADFSIIDNYLRINNPAMEKYNCLSTGCPFSSNVISEMRQHIAAEHPRLLVGLKSSC